MSWNQHILNSSKTINRNTGGDGEAAWALPGMNQHARAEEAQLSAELSRILSEEPADGLSLPSRLTPDRLIRGLWMRRWIIAGIFVASVLLSIGIALFAIQPRWEAVTTLITYQDNEELSVGGGRPYRAPEYGLATLVDTLKLPSSLAEARRRMNIDAELTTIAAAIDVAIARNSNVLNLKVLWDNPSQAAGVANHMAEIFVNKTQHIRKEQAFSDYQRYSDQLEEVRLRVSEADRLVLDYQQKYGVSDFAEETKARLYDLSRLQAEYRTQLSEVDALRIAKAEFEAAIAAQPETLITSRLYRNPLNRRLEEIELQVRALRGHYTDDNPKIVNLLREQATLRKMADQSVDDQTPESTQSLNGLRQDLQLELQKLNDELRVAEGRAVGLEASVSEITDQLAYLSAREKEYFPLKASQETARQLEASLAAKSEEARVASATSNPGFRILELAEIPTQTAASGRKLLVVVLSLFGLCAGFLLAFLLEFFDPYVNDRQDAEDLLPDVAAAGFSVDASHRIRPTDSGQRDAQAWRRFVNDVQVDEEISTIAVVSVHQTRGRSAVAWNLATCLALKGQATVLVDADATVTPGKGPDSATRPGVTDWLLDRATIKDCLRTCEISGLRILDAAVPSSHKHATPWLGTRDAGRIMARLGSLPDRIIYDLPPLADDERALEFAAAIGTVVLVCRSGKTTRKEVGELLGRLKAQGVRVIGNVVLGIPEERMQQYRPLEFFRSLMPRQALGTTVVQGDQHA